ncbi:MAG: GntR family transcriptional regulator [Bosea sp.]|uniref:GntR family transcriptional regulator n=1 Tax=Bosea sp. (in: a-proteobacteria) TaxID=1871050 RepID=UPI001AC41968|nr:GntR family transcriptional regulator [Bosea sp. (in: a-proteobacteria)]MBN9467215.1 GntR family transcriptional regulator [Bosea sp. (in: a-proteobacteria)]
MGFAGEASSTLAVEAYRRLEEMIILGELRPGTRLSEQTLAQALALGRTPIREALQRLRENNLVDILPRSGVFVTDVDFRDQFLLMEVRRPLECQVAVRAARLASNEDRARFMEMAQRMRAVVDAGDKVGLMNVDRSFKDLSLRVARNKFLTAALAPIQANSRRVYFMHLEATNIPIGHAHADAIEAIGRGDVDRSVEAATQFLDEMESFLRRQLANSLVFS